MRYHAESADDLFRRILLILIEIPRVTLNGIFQNWMELLQKCFHMAGDYVG
jgi:hypothetical protein